MNKREWYAVLLSLIYYFCILSAYYIMRPIRDQFAASMGSAYLPKFFIVTFIGTVILTPLFAKLVSTWPRQKIMPSVYLFLIICQLCFVFLFQHPGLISRINLGFAFFVWVSLFNLFAVSVFWSFMTDIWGNEQSRHYFPLIAIGGTLGAILGPLITSSFVDVIGQTWLLIISTILLASAVLCIILLGIWAHHFGKHKDEINSEAALNGGMWDGIKQIFVNPFIRTLAVIMLLSDAIGTIAYVLVTDYSGITFHNNPIAQTQFAANIDLTTNIIQIIAQLTFTRWLLIRFGAQALFALWSFIIVCACLMVYAAADPYSPMIGIMPPVAIAMIITRSLSYGMLQPAKETLYTRVPRVLRYKGKNAVDTVVWRAGDIGSMMAISGLTAIGMTISSFALVWAGLATLSGYIGYRLANNKET